MDGANGIRQVTIRERWEEIRYGSVGRFLGYVVAFTGLFVVVTLVLWAIERFSH